MQHYLITLDYDCNRSDYVYGSIVLNETEVTLLNQNMSQTVKFGNNDNDDGSLLRDCISIIPIDETELKVLQRLGLDGFGELSSNKKYRLFEYQDVDYSDSEDLVEQEYQQMLKDEEEEGGFFENMTTL